MVSASRLSLRLFTYALAIWRLIPYLRYWYSLCFCWMLRLFSVKAHEESCRGVRFVDSGTGNALLPFVTDLSYVLANLWAHLHCILWIIQIFVSYSAMLQTWCCKISSFKLAILELIRRGTYSDTSCCVPYLTMSWLFSSCCDLVQWFCLGQWIAQFLPRM